MALVYHTKYQQHKWRHHAEYAKVPNVLFRYYAADSIRLRNEHYAKLQLPQVLAEGVLQLDVNWLLFELVVLEVVSSFYCVLVKMIPILHGESLEILLLLTFIRNFNMLIALYLINQEFPREVASVLVRCIVV